MTKDSSNEKFIFLRTVFGDVGEGSEKLSSQKIELTEFICLSKIYGP